MSHWSSVHGLVSSQAFGAPGEHAPSTHLSSSVHLLPSSHAIATALFTQPIALSHESAVQGLLSSQAILLPLQALPSHLSPVVHASPSVHPTWSRTLTHPVLMSQASSVQGLLSSQTFGTPLHVPIWPAQTSLSVHALPSSHFVSLPATLPSLDHEHVPVIRPPSETVLVQTVAAWHGPWSFVPQASHVTALRQGGGASSTLVAEASPSCTAATGIESPHAANAAHVKAAAMAARLNLTMEVSSSLSGLLSAAGSPQALSF